MRVTVTKRALRRYRYLPLNIEEAHSPHEKAPPVPEDGGEECKSSITSEHERQHVLTFIKLATPSGFCSVE